MEEKTRVKDAVSMVWCWWHQSKPVFCMYSRCQSTPVSPSLQFLAFLDSLVMWDQTVLEHKILLPQLLPPKVWDGRYVPPYTVIMSLC